MAYPQRSQWGNFQNPEFSRLNHQIEEQTKALLRERQSLANNYNNYQQPFLRPVQSQNIFKKSQSIDLTINNQNNQNNHKQGLAKKVQQLVKLSRNQNIDFAAQLSKVLNAQNEIYEVAKSTNQSQSHTSNKNYLQNPIIQAQKQSSLAQGSRSKVNSNISKSTSKVQRPSNQQNKLLKYQTKDELLQMIQQIQRKALNEIQSLRSQKIELMTQLKSQIQSNNELQKQLNQLSNKNPNSSPKNQTPFKKYSSQPPIQVIPQQLLTRIKQQMDSLRRQNLQFRNNLTSQNTFGPSSSHSQQSELSKKLVYLQTEIQRRDLLIKQLMNQIQQQQANGYKSVDPQGLRNLLEQGDQIRRQTLRFIRMKAEGQNQQHTQSYTQQPQQSYINELQHKIRDLDQQLQQQQAQKQKFVVDLMAFKQKFQQMQQENKRFRATGKDSYSYDSNSNLPASLSPIYRKYGHERTNSLEQYQNHLKQIKSVY